MNVGLTVIKSDFSLLIYIYSNITYLINEMKVFKGHAYTTSFQTDFCINCATHFLLLHVYS